MGQTVPILWAMEARDIIDLWQTKDVTASENLAADLGEKPETVRKWRTRNWIPPIHWPDLLEKAKKRRIKLTLENLRNMKAAAA